MKTLVMIGSGLLCMLFLSSAMPKEEKRPQVTVTPERLDLFVDQQTDPYTIKVAYTLHIPPKYIRPCGRMVYKPYFQGQGQRYDLTPLIISGRGNIRQEKRLEELTGKEPEYPGAVDMEAIRDSMSIEMMEIVPFQVWMAQAQLKADVILEACDRQKETYTLTLANGALWLPQGPGPALVKYEKEQVEVEKIQEIMLFFPVAKYALDDHYGSNSKGLEEITNLFDSLRMKPGMHLKKVMLVGSSSPFGSLDFNRSLAEKRAEGMKQWLIKDKQVDPQIIRTSFITENWEGFRQKIMKSDLPYKAEVLRILDGKYTDQQRKGLMEKLPEYAYIRDHIYSELQHVVFVFWYTQPEEVIKVIPE